jgi:hypothetical protein
MIKMATKYSYLGTQNRLGLYSEDYLYTGSACYYY